jgi:hypothetical protein
MKTRGLKPGMPHEKIPKMAGSEYSTGETLKNQSPWNRLILDWIRQQITS